MASRVKSGSKTTRSTRSKSSASATTKKTTTSRTSTATNLKTLKNIPIIEATIIAPEAVAYTFCYKNFSTQSNQASSQHKTTPLAQIQNNSMGQIEIVNLKKQIEALRNENNELTAKLNNKANEQANQNNSLANENNNLINENNNLTNENHTLTKQNNALSNENNNLIKEKNVLENEKSQLLGELDALKKNLEQAQKDINEIKNNNIRLNNDLNHANQINNNLKKDINNFQQQINDLNEVNKQQQVKIQQKEQANIPPPPPIPPQNQSNQQAHGQPTNNIDFQQKEEQWLKTKAELEQKINDLSLALENERQQLISKLQTKSKEAQGIVNQKLEELEEKQKADLANAKLKIFEDTISKFLEPIILFEQTISSANNNPAIANYLQGFNMIVSMFKDSLSLLGTEEIDVKPGDEFNENWMSAFEVVEDPKFGHNQVVKVVSKGYAFNGKVIKYVSVKVAK